MSAVPYPAYGNNVGATASMYPPSPGPEYTSSSQYFLTNSSTSVPGKHVFVSGPISRTPSPTPSEAEALARESFIDWKSVFSRRFWLRRDRIGYYLIAITLIVLVALITIFHHKIVTKLTPVAHSVKSLPGGWTIPIGLLFIVSFPPLFGHEIIAILCGVTWGLWIGFAIVAAGTFLGEMANFFASKYCCRARGEKLEKKNLQYGCLALAVRNGGFGMALMARYSIIPGHFTTAVFATCGMSVWIFALAAFLSLPKQFATVYIGVIFEESGNQTFTQHLESYLVFIVTAIVTLVAVWYIFRELNRVKPAVIYYRRKARQEKTERLRAAPYNASSTSTFSHHASDSETPLWPYGTSRDPSFEGSSNQHWDDTGRTGYTGYAPDSRLLAPRPRPPSFDPATLYDPPIATAAMTSSIGPEPESEWSNAASTAPSGAPAPGGHTHIGASPPSIHPFASSPNAGAGSVLAQPH